MLQQRGVACVARSEGGPAALSDAVAGVLAKGGGPICPDESERLL